MEKIIDHWSLILDELNLSVKLMQMWNLFSHLIPTLVVGRLAECVDYVCAQGGAISVDCRRAGDSLGKLTKR